MSDDASLAIRRAAVRLSASAPTYPQITPQLAKSRLVLLGEASHGTREFYRVRAAITRELIEVFGFNAVVVEADWPDAYRVNRWVRGASRDRTAGEALRGFQRFPQWMWRNRDVVDFIRWLRDRNQRCEPGDRVGFYGMDLYSLHASIDVVLAYLAKVDPKAARRARERYACFEHFGQDPQAYGYATAFGMSDDGEQDVVEQLVELRRRAAAYAARDGRVAEDDYFFSEQNARVVLNAERYYRTMFRGRDESWNLRDTHMFETLEALMAHLGRDRRTVRLAVWAHNSHLGDARATETGERGELNVGQLVRERYGSRATLVGFTTHDGTVTAAPEWEAPAERKRVRPSLAGSYERLFHESDAGDFMIRTDDPAVRGVLAGPRLERAIGVIYKPETERGSHYFHARLPQQFDMVIHFDTTHAVEPLEQWAREEAHEPAETYPTGM
jgi:erythromycin esterase-like protein